MSEPVLPAGRPLRVALVCLGNICRSPMAHAVLEQRLAAAGLADRVEVTSAGTGGWHTGEPMDERAADVLRSRGYDPSRHRASTFDRSWFDRDLILVMDRSNRADVLSLGALTERVRMFRDFDPLADQPPLDRVVPDPWYGGREDFLDVLTLIERTSEAFVERLATLDR